MEIERKFLLTSLPNQTPLEEVEVYQGYISIDPEVRIRSYEVISGPDKGKKNFKLALKSDGTLSREEIETFISEDFFNKAKKFIGKSLIHKDYYKYVIDGQIIECSCVDNSFYYAEKEFKTEEEAKQFTLPIKETIEVTYDKSYKMKNYWKRTRLKEE